MSAWYPTQPMAPASAWRGLDGPARALRVLLVLVAFALGVSIVAAIVHRNVYDSYDRGDASLSSLDSAEAFVGMAALFVTGFTIAIFVLTIVWQWRLAKNHELLCRPESSLGPGWAIGGWFIPLANLVLPYLQFRELWKGSEPGLARCDPSWRRIRVAPLLWCWWGAFVASYVIEWGSTVRIAFSTEGFETNTIDTGGTVATNVVRIVAAVLYLAVVRRLTERQQRAIAEAGAAQALGWGSAAGPAAQTAGYGYGYGTGAPGYGAPGYGAPGYSAPTGSWTPPPLGPPVDLAPGWKPDPTGRASYRYWDGTRWTEHAATGGQAFTNPL